MTAAREWTPYGVEVGGAQPGLGYAGEWFDAAVGLQYLRTRWYDVATGRFTSRDPWEGILWQSVHSYTYVSNNPINSRDPSGLVDCLAWPPPLRAICQNAEAGDLDTIELFYTAVVGYGNLRGGDHRLASKMMAHYIDGGGSKLELDSYWARKIMDDPNILRERMRLLNAFIENDVRRSVQKPNFPITSEYEGLRDLFYSWNQRPRPKSDGLYAATGHIAINGEFSAKGEHVCHVAGYVVSYSARYSVDKSERYEWFWDNASDTGTVTNFGNIFGTGDIEVPHKWAVALRDANPPRAHEYDWTAMLQQRGRILLKRYSWRLLKWWESPQLGVWGGN